MCKLPRGLLSEASKAQSFFPWVPFCLNALPAQGRTMSHSAARLAFVQPSTYNLYSRCPILSPAVSSPLVASKVKSSSRVRF